MEVLYVCPILFVCNQVQESASHFLFKCRFTIRISNTVYIFYLVGTNKHRYISLGKCSASYKGWWTSLASGHDSIGKAMASMLMLVYGDVWKDRDFRNNASTTTIIIKDQRWGIAEAKFVCNALPGEQANVKVLGFVLGICVEPLNFFSINENGNFFAFCFKKIHSLR
jgi:hypothetical protein